MHQFAHWKAALQGAVTPSEVRQVMEEYASRIAAGDKVTLPSACKGVLRAVDIDLGAETLIREELKYDGDAATAALLHEISHTFVAAANRIAFLESQG